MLWRGELIKMCAAMCAVKLIKTVCVCVCVALERVEWNICLCIDGLVLALWGSCSRFLNPFSYEPLYLDIQHSYFLSRFLFCLWICTYCTCPICNQVCNLCGYTVRSIQHCWSIDTRAQMANHQCSVWLSITLSLLLNRGLQQVNSANRMNSSASLSLSQRKPRREGEMDGWCCALAV